MQLAHVLAILTAASRAAALPTEPAARVPALRNDAAPLPVIAVRQNQVAARQNEVRDLADDFEAILGNLGGLGELDLEAILKAALGAAVDKIEEQLEGTLAGLILSIIQNGIPADFVAQLLAAIAEIVGGADVATVNATLNAQTSGTFPSVDAALGTTNIGEALQAVEKRQSAGDFQDIIDNLGGLGELDLEAILKAALGAAVDKIEEQLEGTLAGLILSIIQNGIPADFVAQLLAAIAQIIGGADVATVNAALNEQTGGTFPSVDAALGTTNIGAILQGA